MESLVVGTRDSLGDCWLRLALETLNFKKGGKQQARVPVLLAEKT
jgi:hypothetical protein